MFRLLIDLFNARKKTWIFVVLALLANLLVAVYVANFQNPQLDRLRAVWQEKRKLVAGSPADLGSVYRQGTGDLTKFRELMPEKKEFARVIGDLLESAANNNLKAGAITYKPEPIPEEKLIRYAISLSVSGKYAAVKSFIADVRRSHEIITIESVALGGARDATEEAVALRLQLNAYFRAEGK